MPMLRPHFDERELNQGALEASMGLSAEQQGDPLDVAVGAYEQMPLFQQIAMGMTPPGMAIDVAEATKYGRDAYRSLAEGEYGPAAMAGGIAALSTLGLVPLVGDVAKAGGKRLIKGIEGLRRSPVEDMEDLTKAVFDRATDDISRLHEILPEIKDHRAIRDAVRRMGEIPETNAHEMYGTADWLRDRMFRFGEAGVQGYDDAVEMLYRNARRLAYVEEGVEFPAHRVLAGDLDTPVAYVDDVLRLGESVSPGRIAGAAQATRRTTAGPKTATIVIGPPASGKSGIANPIAIKYEATIVDPDEIKKVMPEYGGGVGANAVHNESKAINNVIEDLAIDMEDNVLIPTVGGDIGKLRRMAQKYRAAGYEVNLVLVDVPNEVALLRMYRRMARTGRLINPEAFAKYGNKPTKNYELLREEGIADGYARIDNSGALDEPRTVIEDTRGIFTDTGLRLRESRRYGGSIKSNRSLSRRSQAGLREAEEFIDIHIDDYDNGGNPTIFVELDS